MKLDLDNAVFYTANIAYKKVWCPRCVITAWHGDNSNFAIYPITEGEPKTNVTDDLIKSALMTEALIYKLILSSK